MTTESFLTYTFYYVWLHDKVAKAQMYKVIVEFKGLYIEFDGNMNEWDNIAI